MAGEKGSQASITFHGGTGSVTGANFLLETPERKKILVDCGFFQGSKVADDENRKPFPYDPATIDALCVTHAHLDHIGRIPKLVRDGFRGPIYSTPPTREISEVSLIDSLGVLEKEARGSNSKPIYTEEDVLTTMRQWQAVEYHHPFQIGGVKVVMHDSGHILGSAMFEFEINSKKIVFTGDLGNSPSLLLADSELVKDADYLVMESVYGDRNHEDRQAAKDVLEDVIESTARRGGTLMIPAFSIERTQELVYEIEQMMEGSKIPLVPVYLDSPLAIKVTAIYKKYQYYFNQATKAAQKLGDGIFTFPQLHRCLTTEESKAIAQMAGSKIVIAGSGMSNGGRIVHHEKRYLSDRKSALLVTGYQAAGSLGRMLQDGARSIRILGEEIEVKAKVVSISGYSAHKGSDDLLAFVTNSADTLKKVFVVMGEPKASLYLVQRIRDYLGLDARTPAPHERVIIDL